MQELKNNLEYWGKKAWHTYIFIVICLNCWFAFHWCKGKWQIFFLFSFFLYLKRCWWWYTTIGRRQTVLYFLFFINWELNIGVFINLFRSLEDILGKNLMMVNNWHRRYCFPILQHWLSSLSPPPPFCSSAKASRT